MKIRFTKKRLTVLFMGTTWLTSIVMGLFLLLCYENTPGVAATPRPQWPSGSLVHPVTDRATLVLFAHPQCPCTVATIEQLDDIVTRTQGKLNAYVFFLKPTGVPDNWEKTKLWKSAAAIPGVQVLTDAGGREARRFHVKTSGQALLFGPQGHLLFSGGITIARGHEGPSAGGESIVSLIYTGKSALYKTPVFGCSLLDPTAS